MSIVKSITFENYKAFIKGSIEFKPITILLGANSVGKSSIIQLLLMLQQTATVKNVYDRSLFKLNGNNVSMGDNINLIRNHDMRYQFGMTFGFTTDFGRYFSMKIKDQFFNILDYVSLFSKAEFKLSHREMNSMYKDDIRIALNNLKDVVTGQNNRWADAVKNITDNIDEYLMTFEYLSAVTEYLNGNGTMSVNVVSKCSSSAKSKMHNINLDRISVCAGGKIIIGIRRKSSKNFTLESSFFSDTAKNFLNSNNVKRSLKKAVPDLSGNLFSLFKKSSFFSSLGQFEDKSCQSYFILMSLFMLSVAMNNVKEAFSETNINYVSPLRAYPKRFYFLDRTSITGSLDTLDGDSLTELLKENAILKDNVNKWLDHFDLKIDVEAVEDIIHKLKVNQNGLSLDITDVGFGISQILPVIVQGFFTSPGSLTVIEQPEVHLHPKMQADLGDLFIDIAMPKSENGERDYAKSLLIETHSEYLLKRIRRRIATNDISSNDVAIYMVKLDKESNCSIIEKINIENNGAFEWPEEFYGGELLKDMIEFLAAQTEN